MQTDKRGKYFNTGRGKTTEDTSDLRSAGTEDRKEERNY
jgi:hypothetical protein